MKVKLLCGSLVLALVSTIILPASMLAAKPAQFEANGSIAYITPGDVFAAGASGRWVVAEREITGVLSGDISGDFTMTYKANIESLATQAGNLHGTVTVDGGSYILEINGKIEPLATVGFVYWEVAPGYWTWIPKLKLSFDGHGTFLKGAKGNGDFHADIVFLPTPDGHVGFIFPDESLFSISGQWQT